MLLVRVKNKATGHEYNMAAALAEADDGVTVLDKPTHTPHGTEIPPKHALKPPRAKAGGTATTAADHEADKEAGE